MLRNYRQASHLWIDLPDEAVERHRVVSEVAPIKDLHATNKDNTFLSLNFSCLFVQLTASG